MKLKMKLTNKVLGGEGQNWKFELDGNILGPLEVILISNAQDGKEGPVVGRRTVLSHLRSEYFGVQVPSLPDDERLLPKDSMDVLKDPRENFYTHAIAELGGKAIGFAVVDKIIGGKIGGKNYVSMFYPPTFKDNFSGSYAVKGNEQKENLPELLERVSINHIRGNNLAMVSDIPASEASKVPEGYRVLAPKISVPSIKSGESEGYKESDRIHIIVRAPKNAEEYNEGIDLEQFVRIYTRTIREGHYDYYDPRKPNKQEAALNIYLDGVRTIIDNAVKKGERIIVPYLGEEIHGTIPLSGEEKRNLEQRYLEIAGNGFKEYTKPTR